MPKTLPKFAVFPVTPTGRGLATDLRPGEYLVGRSDKARVRIDNPQVSWEHLVINMNDTGVVTIENRSSTGTQHNDQKISKKVAIKPGDRVRLSDDVELHFEGAAAEASMGRILLLAVPVILAIAIAAIAMSSKEEAGPSRDYNHAYIELSRWLEQQVAAGRVDRHTQMLFRDAWRLESNRQHQRALRVWSLAGIALGATRIEGKQNWASISAQNPFALGKLLGGEETQVDDESGPAAIVQFARESARYNAKALEEAEESE